MDNSISTILIFRVGAGTREIAINARSEGQTGLRIHFNGQKISLTLTTSGMGQVKWNKGDIFSEMKRRR
jgi:hypothetical protein